MERAHVLTIVVRVVGVVVDLQIERQVFFCGLERSTDILFLIGPRGRDRSYVIKLWPLIHGLLILCMHKHRLPPFLIIAWALIVRMQPCIALGHGLCD